MLKNGLFYVVGWYEHLLDGQAGPGSHGQWLRRELKGDAGPSFKTVCRYFEEGQDDRWDRY